jgi:hypothetical protein
VHRVGVGHRQRKQGVAAFVIGGHPALFFGHDHGLALGAHHDLVLGLLEVALHDHAAVLARAHQRGLR